MNSIDEAGKLMMAEAEPEFGAVLAEDLAELNRKWENVLRLAANQKQSLESALDKSKVFCMFDTTCSSCSEIRVRKKMRKK